MTLAVNQSRRRGRKALIRCGEAGGAVTHCCIDAGTSHPQGRASGRCLDLNGLGHRLHKFSSGGRQQEIGAEPPRGSCSATGNGSHWHNSVTRNQSRDARMPDGPKAVKAWTYTASLQLARKGAPRRGSLLRQRVPRRDVATRPREHFGGKLDGRSPLSRNATVALRPSALSGEKIRGSFPSVQASKQSPVIAGNIR